VRAGRTLTGMDAIEEAESEKAGRHPWWSLERWGARLLYSLLAGTVINVATGINALGTVIAVVLFVLTTVIVEVSRRR
jgi:hypothetical protein